MYSNFDQSKIKPNIKVIDWVWQVLFADNFHGNRKRMF